MIKFTRKLDIARGNVNLAHGAGGRAATQLVNEIFYPAFANEYLFAGNDQAILPLSGGRLAMSTDSFVVSPLFFPGGDIGVLAVNGVINDLAMGGARPLYLSASFIIEEGFSFAQLRQIAENMGSAARSADVMIVTGDTKVVEHGKADGVFVTTAGVGVLPDGVNLSGNRARPGDSVILSGSIGDHGVAVMMARQNLGFDAQVESDCAALHDLVAVMLATAGPSIRLMRDPTRGGLAASLNEIAQQSQVGFRLREADIPVKPAVAAVCELLGLDPLNVANEGKLVAVVDSAVAPALLAQMRTHPLGRDAALIGTVVEDVHRFVEMETKFGGRRIVDWLSGEQLPRIC